MYKTVAALVIGLALFLSQTAFASEETPDAVIELSGGTVAAGIGFAWGHGTLIYQGKRYPLAVSGLSVVSVGVTEYTAAGTVTGLKKPQDINGIYTAVTAGGTLGGGGSIAAMTNHRGVTIHMTATSEGLNFTLAAEGMKIRLVE
jgi:hypothetical protein